MAWIDELDLRVGPPDAAMGTRALDPSRWLLHGDDWDDQVAEANHLLDTRRADVLAGDTTSAAAHELLVLVEESVAAATDSSTRSDDDPLAAARRLVAEDLCLLTPTTDGQWVLAAGAVCFPSYWVLTEKVGRPLTAVHEPAPGYAGPLATRVDTFLGRLKPGQGVWRRNWSIHDSPALHVPRHDHSSTTTDRWLRSEYQTLRRLPSAEAVVFTIRTQQLPLADVPPTTRQRIAAAVRGWSPAVHRYKGAAIDADLLEAMEHPQGS